MTSIARGAWLRLYKDLHKAASEFSQYNYRLFAHRRIRDHFEKNRSVRDPVQLEQLFNKGQENLKSLKRQTALDNIYPHTNTVIEDKLAKH